MNDHDVSRHMGADRREHNTAAGTQAVGRGFDLVRVLAEHHQGGVGLSQPELVSELGLSRPTVERLLKQAIASGFVERLGTPRHYRYRLGPAAHRVARAIDPRSGVHEDALLAVARLAHRTGDTALLWRRDGHHALCVYREDGQYPYRTHDLYAGDRHPLGTGGGAIALAAALPAEEIEQIIVDNDAEVQARCAAGEYRFGSDWIRTHVAEARQRGGVGLNDGLVYEESHALAVSIAPAAQGSPQYALSIAAIRSRMQQHGYDQLTELLQEAARGLARHQDQ